MTVFIQNKYTNWYYSIIENAKTRVLPEGTYTETHHIIPASFFKKHNRKSRAGWLDGKHNSPDNLVDLTAREHFACHWLLTKMTDGEANIKMFYAFHFISRLVGEHDVKITSRTYGIIRNKVSEHMTNNNPMHKLTPEEHANRSAKLAVSVKKSWESRDRDGMGEHLKQVWDGKTDEELQVHSEKVIESLSKLTPEQKAEAKRKRLESCNNRTPEEIAESERKRKETNANKSPEEIAESERKRKETNAAKSPEVIADEKRRRAETIASKSEEEKQAIIDKRVETLQNRDTIECPHCGVSSRSPVNMKRYHFDNCLKHPNPKPREPMKRTACVHCGEMVTNNIMAMYHGDKCKHKPDE
jgi:hypothetical protein